MDTSSLYAQEIQLNAHVNSVYWTVITYGKHYFPPVELADLELRPFM